MESRISRKRSKIREDQRGSEEREMNDQKFIKDQRGSVDQKIKRSSSEEFKIKIRGSGNKKIRGSERSKRINGTEAFKKKIRG